MSTYLDRLYSTELQYADISGIDLRGANLAGACFDDCDLTGASPVNSNGQNGRSELCSPANHDPYDQATPRGTTLKSRTQAEAMKGRNQNMHRKSIIGYALFRGLFHVNPFKSVARRGVEASSEPSLISVRANSVALLSRAAFAL